MPARAARRLCGWSSFSRRSSLSGAVQFESRREKLGIVVVGRVVEERIGERLLVHRDGLVRIGPDDAARAAFRKAGNDEVLVFVEIDGRVEGRIVNAE